jgi:hypothetical protein
LQTGKFPICLPTFSFSYFISLIRFSDGAGDNALHYATIGAKADAILTLGTVGFDSVAEPVDFCPDQAPACQKFWLQLQL